MSLVYDVVSNGYTRRKQMDVLCGALGRGGGEDCDE